MQSHCEFRALPDAKQRQLCRQNILNGVAMMTSKLETCKTGEDQLTYACGNFDNKIWRTEFKDFFNKNSKVKKLTMFESNKSSGFLPQSYIKTFNKLVWSIGSLIQDPDMHKLLTLVVLFTDVDYEDMPDIVRLRDRYMNILRRRQRRLGDDKALADDWDDEDGFVYGQLLYSRFNSCICDVKELTTIIAKLYR